MSDLRAAVEGLDFRWWAQCVCDYRQERPNVMADDDAPDPDCGNCGHTLTDHPNGWTCAAKVRKPKNPKVLLEEVLALIPEGAVLVTEEGLARAWWSAVNEPEDGPWDDASEWAAAILRHLRETP